MEGVGVCQHFMYSREQWQSRGGGASGSSLSEANGGIRGGGLVPAAGAAIGAAARHKKPVLAKLMNGVRARSQNAATAPWCSWPKRLMRLLGVPR